MNKHTKSTSFLKGKGFYAALTLVIAGAALASFLAINNMMDTLGTKNSRELEEKQWGFEDTQVENKQDNIPKPQSSSSASSNAASSQALPTEQSGKSKESSGQPVPPTPSYQLPMSGQVTEPFSGDELVYNVTMGDWRTHNGMDIAGVVKQGVHAPMAATVAKVYADDMWGHVVEISDGTYTVRVKGLSKDVLVNEGDKVEQGATLGMLGEIAAEGAAETHLHVEVEQNGILVDPASILK